MPIKIGNKTFQKFADAEEHIKNTMPGISDPAAYVASIENKQETITVLPEQLIKGINVEMEHTNNREIAKKIALDHLNEVPDYYDKLEQAMPGEVSKAQNDPRGDGPVKDPGNMRNGQPNIIDYSDKEPLVFGAGENSSHEYPGKIIITNESNYVDREVKKNTIPGPAATGESQPLNDKTQPTLPTGGPQVIPPGVENNKHGYNFNQNLNQDITITPPGARRKTNEEEIKLQPYHEAEFNEQDHPRAPAGSSDGGQFVSSGSEIPQGTTSEDKKLREQYFEDSNADNKKVRLLQDDLLGARLDAGMARVKKLPDEEAAADAEVARLESEQIKLIQKLQQSGKLEGSQAQGALLEIDRLNEEAAKKKPGSKGEANLKMEAHMMGIRLDLIRRGKIADYDILGNPTNEAGRIEHAAKQDAKAKMEKPVTKATKSDLVGFSSNPKIKLGNNVPVETLNNFKKIWNGLEESDRKLIDNITVRSSRASGAITAGEWIPETGTMEITAHPLFTEKDYDETVHHEIGHAKYKLRTPEQIQKWHAAIKEIQAPTKYAKYHQSRYQDYMLTRFRAEDRPIIMDNIEKLKNLYYEEVHSEVYSHKKSPLPDKKIWSKEGLAAAIKAFDEVFS